MIDNNKAPKRYRHTLAAVGSGRRHIWLDLDGTLFPASMVAHPCDAMKSVYTRMGLTSADIKLARSMVPIEYRDNPFNVAAKICMEYGFDHRRFLTELSRGIDYSNLSENAALEEVILRLRRRMFNFSIVTNNFCLYAGEAVRRVLGGGFSGGIFCTDSFLHDGWYVRKPSEYYFNAALAATKARADDVIFFDNSPRNVQAAFDMGIHAYLANPSTIVGQLEAILNG